MSFTFEFDLAHEEHVRGSRLVNLRRPIIRIMLAGSVVAALLATGAFATGVTWAGQDPWFVLLLGWCLPVSVVAGLLIGPQVQVRAMRLKNRAAVGPHVYTLTDTGLATSSLGATSTLQWDNVVEVFESREFILFYYAASWAQLLPKRVVPPESLPSLRAAVTRWIGARARVME